MSNRRIRILDHKESVAIGEFQYFKRMITEIYTSGIVSVVADTYDFWNAITNFTQKLIPEILARNGKVVFRPDSGDPEKIICGDYEASAHTPAYKGAVEILWDIFGGTVNEFGYKVLDSHVGLIYGDSITPDRAQRILQGLKDKGFAASNIVFGIGSFTYNYTTRDTYGMAVKSTFGIVNGQNRNIFKDPATDSSKMKKSAVGLIRVYKENGRLTYADQQNDINNAGLLETVFLNGNLVREQTLEDIRSKVRAEIEEFIDTKNNKLNPSVSV